MINTTIPIHHYPTAVDLGEIANMLRDYCVKVANLEEDLDIAKRRIEELEDEKGMSITISDMRVYQAKCMSLKTIGEFKELGRELRDKFNLTSGEAIDILNGKDEAILKILEKQEIEDYGSK